MKKIWQLCYEEHLAKQPLKLAFGMVETKIIGLLNLNKPEIKERW